MSNKFHTFTKDGESMVVEAYGSSDLCPIVRPRPYLTSILLNASRTAVSTACFLESAEAENGKTVSNCASNPVKSVLFNGGSILLVVLISSALPNVSCKSFPTSSAICIALCSMAAAAPVCRW